MALSGSMRHTYKFRLCPTKGQRWILEQTLDTCRHLYNNSLDDRKFVYDNSGESISYHDQAVALPLEKDRDPFLCKVHSQVLQDVLRKLDKAFKNFFRRVKKHEKAGYPRFKGKDRYDSFTYPQSGFEIVGDRLKLSKIGSIKLKQHRAIPTGARIKTCTIKRDVDQWYACFSVELPIPVQKKEIINPVGIDLGLNEIATLSNGEKIENPRWLRESAKQLAKEQRRLSKKRKKSRNRGKQRAKVARAHRKIRNQRKDFHHKLSKEWVSKYDLIAFEDLKIKNMVKNPKLAKSIEDAGWNQLVSFTKYKAEDAGIFVELVNPNGTSAECCICGNKQHMSLAQRTFRCPICGSIMDRDENAAVNILHRGLSTVGTTGRACLSSPIGDAMIQEATQLVGG